MMILLLMTFRIKTATYNKGFAESINNSNMRISIPTTLLFSFAAILLCVSCQKKSAKDQMLETSREIIEVIKSGNARDFREFIAVELKLIGKDEEYLESDFAIIKRYYKEHCSAAEPKLLVIEESNSLSQKTVQVIFHKGVPKSTIDYDVRLDLKFGPPQLFGLDKISGYKIIDKSDALIPIEDF